MILRLHRRRVVLALGASVFVVPLASFAQQPAPGIHRIVFLGQRPRSRGSVPDAYYEAFVQGMRELGYVEGKNLLIEWRVADGKPERFAAEWVGLKVDVVVTDSTPAAQIARAATRTVPIVTAAMADPVGSGFAASLARPAGNITGLSLMRVDLSQKNLELLKTMMPKLSRVAVLLNPGHAAHAAIFKGVETAARQLRIKTLPVQASTQEELERGFDMMKRERAQAVIVAGDAFFLSQERRIADLALKNRLLSMTPWQQHTAAGGLMSYGQNLIDNFGRAASYVDKILKGSKPGDLPIEQPTRIHLAINLKTAKALGLTIPPEMMLRADMVIE